MQTLHILNDYDVSLLDNGRTDDWNKLESKYRGSDEDEITARVAKSFLLQSQNRPVKVSLRDFILQKLEMMEPFSPTE